MSARHVYVISDLHLGGAPPGPNTIGFQMCPPESRASLARFIHYIGSAHQGEDTELIINGDFVDFLAEERIGMEGSIPCEAFTFDPNEARAKLQRIIERVTSDSVDGMNVFNALQAFVAHGHKLTILLGNHDVELTLPPVRRALLAHITQGRPNHVELLFDGEAYEVGNLLIEHGNRYDGWNTVLYGLLRAYRSCLSRGEPTPFYYPAAPGSRLVTELMNPLKQRFKFIDLLKPENEALIPILAAIDPDSIATISNLLTLSKKLVESSAMHPKAGHQPALADTIAGASTADTPAREIEQIRQVSVGDSMGKDCIDRSQMLLEQVAKEWQPANAERLASPIAGWTTKAKGILYFIAQVLPIPDEVYVKLDRTLQNYRAAIQRTFDLESEAQDYLRAAERLAEGKRIVVFGHTHLAKRIPLAGKGLYLNSGTWCPVIELPMNAMSSEMPLPERVRFLREFVNALQENDIGSKQYLKPTFVKATITAGRATAELFEWKGDGNIEVFRGYRE
jgi:UDP-2,3-diacylglucosamine pyrophosphatase LpxH